VDFVVLVDFLVVLEVEALLVASLFEAVVVAVVVFVVSVPMILARQ
jgi:hypothetical protein